MGSDSPTGFAGFRRNTDACVDERSGASGRCEAGKERLEPSQPGLVGDRRRSARCQKLRRHPRFDLQVVGGCRPVEARSPTSPTEATDIEAQSPRTKTNGRERRSLRSGATTDADGFLVVADPAVGPAIPDPASRRAAMERLSLAGAGRHRNRLAPREELGGSFRPQPQRPASAAAAGADGDVGLSAMPTAVALRTDAAIVSRTDDRHASVGTSRAARLGVDGSRLLELRSVLASPASSSVFRHPPAARRETENAETTGAGRPAGD